MVSDRNAHYKTYSYQEKKKSNLNSIKPPELPLIRKCRGQRSKRSTLKTPWEAVNKIHPVRNTMGLRHI